MKTIDKIYINGAFVTPHGSEVFDLINPTVNQVIGHVILGDETDIRMAIAAAKTAFVQFSNSSIDERIAYLQHLHDAILKRVPELKEATIQEYGATVQRAAWSNQLAAEIFLQFIEVLKGYSFERSMGKSVVRYEPLGVAAILTAWNSNSGSICIKLAAAISAGCTTVIKPSEMSAIQSQILTEAFHEANLPAGVINVVNGRGDITGTELARNPDVAMIAFTGSTVVGKIIAREAVDTVKRVALELSGKAPNVVLDDADLNKAIPMAVNACFMNNGQACIAGSRLLVPESRLEDVKKIVKATISGLRVGDPENEETSIGPLASQKQYDRVQGYIRSAEEEGAELLIGGEGHPDGLNQGFFVKPTAFAGVTRNMRIAKEEVFGPVLSIMTYKTEAEAIEMANDTIYGLLAYVSSSDLQRARRVAAQINAGRVLINTLNHDPLAPFGGFKQSGVGREGGVLGLEEYLEPKAIIE
ncbi:MAG TPA: aldehyde dehydrogenase family protein [Puia sp.]|nr:aldehyde dehydrogenase family protein [Puia sp.]